MLDEEREGLIEEACGICARVEFGAGNYAPWDVLGELGNLQHRGQEAAGIVWWEEHSQRLEVIKSEGLVDELYTKVPQHCQGRVAVGHVRYRTCGVGGIEEAQPLIIESRYGPLVLAHNGHITNADALRAQLEQRGARFMTRGDSEVILHAIAAQHSEDFEQALCEALRALRGAFSVVIYAPEHGLFACRDAHGVRPLALVRGESWNMVVSEAQTPMASEQWREVKPGELVRLDMDGSVRSLWPFEPVPRRACVFELVYFAASSSTMFVDQEVYQVRWQLGFELGEESEPCDVDLVVDVPGSSYAAAMGYAHATGAMYMPVIRRRAGVGRSFLAPTQAEREELVRAKFEIDVERVRGKRIVVVDDSLVRGTTARGIVKMLREAGAAAIHLRIASPAIIAPCRYGIDTPNREELIAATREEAPLERELGVESLRYLSMKGLYRGVRGEGFCDVCFGGQDGIDASR